MTASARRPNDQLEHDLLVEWLEQARVGLVVLDSGGKVVMLNSAACSKLGVDALSVLHGPVANLVQHTDADLDTLRWLATDGADGERRLAGAVSPGQQLLVKASTLRRPSGFYRVLAISDVTALVQAHAQAALLARQWDALNAALTIADARQPDCPITYVSPKFEQMTGYSAAECVGRNCRFLQGNQGPAQPEVAQMREAIARKQPVQVVMRNYRKDGGMYWVEISISPVHDAQGDVTHFVAIQQPLNAAPARH